MYFSEFSQEIFM